MILLAAAIAATAAPPVVVSPLETAQIADACRGKDADTTASFCTGYILGAFDALSLSHQICPSAASASTVKVVTVARKYLRTHKKSWSSAPTFVIRDALKAAFPCERP
ncbi:Rap1a/Tai family immunity protein [Sphingomonas glacialis]|uniref:Rap1a immunity protein domain-containing protein n=1 Tax=Sphingomonas glacialis TaxID=658225 RepID=A0A502FYD3_9SPHN|nr:Rap1a/Tai family immunity protein [Sphingomonas glacialis]TPG54350.1 hypothetical protein EAH76_06675 [Sphingomonas glacialis]